MYITNSFAKVQMNKGATLALKPIGHITRSPKQEVSVAQQKELVFSKKKI